MEKRDKYLLGAILFFFVTLIYPGVPVASIIGVAAVIIAGLMYNSFSEKIRLFKDRKYIWWMLGFVVLVGVSMLLSSNTDKSFRYLDPRLPLLYFPVSIGLLQLDRSFRNRVLLWMAVIITIFSAICVGYGIYRANLFNDTSLLYNDSLTYSLLRRQSIYISLLVNIAIYIFGWFVLFQPVRYKGAMVLAILLLFVTSFLLASRNMMLVLYGSIVLFGLYYAYSRRKYLEGSVLILAILMGGYLVVKFSPKTVNRFKELAFTQFNYQQDGAESHYNMAVDSSQWNGANTRLAIWRCGWQLFQQSPLLGTGLGDKKDKLMEVYREKGFQFAIRTEKNLHNNYFDILVSMGIIGLVVFLIGWIMLPLKVAWRHKDGLAFLIMFTLAFAMVTENYFDRSLGGMLVGFFIPFLLSDKKSKS